MAFDRRIVLLLLAAVLSMAVDGLALVVRFLPFKYWPAPPRLVPEEV